VCAHSAHFANKQFANKRFLAFLRKAVTSAGTAATERWRGSDGAAVTASLQLGVRQCCRLADTMRQRALGTSAWNRKATGYYDGVTPTLVYMALAWAICGDPEDPRN